MWFEFSEPIHTFAARMGNSVFDWWLYSGDELVDFIPEWVTDFRGFISDKSFDRAQVKPSGGSNVLMNDILFQTIIPALGVLSVVIVAGLATGGRRRRPA